MAVKSRPEPAVPPQGIAARVRSAEPSPRGDHVAAPVLRTLRSPPARRRRRSHPPRVVRRVRARAARRARDRCPLPSPSAAGSEQPGTVRAPRPPAPARGRRRLVVRTRVFDGMLTGLASAASPASSGGRVRLQPRVDALALRRRRSWASSSGQGVLIGRPPGRAGLRRCSPWCSARWPCSVAVYFIDRSLTIAASTDAGRTSDIPLWQGFIDVDRRCTQGW